ncbi:hypothetical protein ES332_D07G085900v1 [Gossypium tomentosum]|uniref:Telomeric single stranded DNA binding POT1/Cdc13 domain-containing protein n=1 Tax=Gossypium tomentosum TaxID=34277 RepID=A0A5D2K498_GOSTO|nr:hypothetical protein ES332_D07G085900v1 [Gossypium tomentosum]
MVYRRFLCIKDAVACINDKVDLIAVILNFSLPQTTRGTDYVCKLKIIDESHPEIPVHVFAQEIDHLPFVAAVGDIIHLSRVVMRIHEGDVYAIFNKKFSSFALYDGKDVENFQPYQVLLRYEARKHDAMIIAGLRKWLASSHVIDEPNFSLLEEINEVGLVNLVCKVLHICKTTDDKWMAFIWDGTDAPPISIYKKPEDEEHNPLPLHFKLLPSSGHVLHTFPTVGTILRLIFDVECMPYILQLLKVCQWFKFFCVECKLHEGLWYGVFTSYSKIRDIPNVDILILERQSNYDCRSLGNLDRMPSWSCPWPSKITEVNCSAPFATLMDVLTCQKEKFFNGLSTGGLKRKLKELLGVPKSDDDGQEEIEGGARNPPWVQCCLKSHSIKRRRWIFDTKLVGYNKFDCTCLVCR